MTDPTDRTQAFQQPRTIRPDILDMSQDARCPDCFGPLVYNHDVYCVGPVQRIADPPVRDEPDCGCVGAWHDPLCPLVTGDAA